MHKWYHIFPKNTGLSLYIWLVFCVLPFYFVFKTSSNVDIIIGLIMISLFFIVYRLSFISTNWPMYIWVAAQIIISVCMTLFFGYVYFSLFLAYFIGHIQQKSGFITMYIIHLVCTLAAITVSFILNTDMLLSQIPFIIICIIAIILMPFTIHNRIKQEKLEALLEDANEKIANLLVMEERQRIARDLHDTLGQKLSLIGLKSDLAEKIVVDDPASAKVEMKDIHVTARTALKEVREMVSNMRTIKLEDELFRIQQLLRAAQIDVIVEGDPNDLQTTLLIENVLSMCLKEAVTNIVHHSQASNCWITFAQRADEIMMTIKDNGQGIVLDAEHHGQGHGIKGMRERIEFINGRLTIKSKDGTMIDLRIPNVIQS